MTQRGVIRNEAYARQQIRWPTMRWGNITPTDIDAVIEFHNKLFIYFEVKHVSSQLNTGQRILFERKCSRILSSGAYCYALVGTHNEKSEFILLENCMLTEYWHNNVWHKPNEHISIGECVNRLYKLHISPF